MGGIVPPLTLPVVELLGMWHAEPEGRRRSLRAAARTRTYHDVLRIMPGSTLSRVFAARVCVCVLCLTHVSVCALFSSAGVLREVAGVEV